MSFVGSAPPHTLTQSCSEPVLGGIEGRPSEQHRTRRVTAHRAWGQVRRLSRLPGGTQRRSRRDGRNARPRRADGSAPAGTERGRVGVGSSDATGCARGAGMGARRGRPRKRGAAAVRRPREVTAERPQAARRRDQQRPRRRGAGRGRAARRARECSGGVTAQAARHGATRAACDCGNGGLGGCRYRVQQRPRRRGAGRGRAARRARAGAPGARPRKRHATAQRW